MALRSRLRKIFLYGLSRGTTDGLLALRGLLLASLLGPAAFGGWVLFRLATNYCGLARLGVNAGLEFHVSRIPGPKGLHSGLAFWRTTLGFVLAVFGVLALTALGASFLTENAALALGMRWFAGAIITEQVWLVGLAYLRSRGDLRGYAFYEITNAALQLTFAAVLTPIWGLGGAFAAFVLATTVSLALLARSIPMSPAFQRERLSKLLQVGFPVLVSLVLGYSLASADRLIVAAHGDMSLLGMYGFAFSVAGIAGSLAWIIRVVVFPDVYAGVAERGEGPALRAHLDETVRPFATILPPLIGLAALMMGPAVSLVFPTYEVAIPAARLLLFIGVTAGFERLGTLGVVAAGRQRVLPLISGAALALNVTLAFLALRSGLGLQGVAAAALISTAGFGLAALWLVARIAHDTDPFRFVTRATLSLAWCSSSVVALGALRPGLSVPYTLGTLGLYLAAMIPLLPGCLSELRKAWQRSRRPVRDSDPGVRISPTLGMTSE
jgi:O-antigen/teichoic acid export membrane protein